MTKKSPINLGYLASASEAFSALSVQPAALNAFQKSQDIWLQKRYFPPNLSPIQLMQRANYTIRRAGSAFCLF